MKLPFVSRFAYDEMKAELTARALRAENEKEVLLNKLLRLSLGDDSEQVEQIQAAEQEEVEEGPVSRAKRVTGSSMPSVVRRAMERENAKNFHRRREGNPQEVLADMEEAFTQQ